MNAEQFRLAQQAADEAYAMTLEAGGTDEQAARDYADVMQAYNDAQQVKPGWFVNPAVTLDTLPADVIADMKARCAETARDDAKDDAMGRPW